MQRDIFVFSKFEHILAKMAVMRSRDLSENFPAAVATALLMTTVEVTIGLYSAISASLSCSGYMRNVVRWLLYLGLEVSC